jgi:hypothetical protein
LTVAQKLDDLALEYDNRRRLLQEQFDKDKAAFDTASADYRQKKLAYDDAIRYCPTATVGATVPMIDASGHFTFGSETPKENQCSVPEFPVAPQEPRFPIVAVDSQWSATVESAQDEVGALFEEFRHRAGGYVRFLSPQSTYSDESPGLTHRAADLRNEANELR